MNTQNVKTAAQESSGRPETNALSMLQILDLFLYIMANSEGQKQPGFFVPPDNGEIFVIQSVGEIETLIVWMLDGWPLAAASPESQYLAVLTGKKITDTSREIEF
ncbi:hypothetical protein [Cronobacter dublinensis]|uniref:hypothetical protein n=1 Tax=Cronobacter dublinensis TaxID=413497 RepID=UPI000CFD3B71|nr:hypothetical protein [Cronobacter dublinensis]